MGVGVRSIRNLAGEARSAALCAKNAHVLSRRGLTLIEMMISVVLTLLIVFAVVQAFQMMGTGMTNGRAAIEIMASVRSPVAQLQRELDNVTCPVRPVVDPRQGLGYFYYLEGPNSDRNYNESTEPDNARDLGIDALRGEVTHFGDTDDVLAFTCTRPEAPFQAQAVRHDGTIISIESTTAEVVWWMATVVKPNSAGNYVESARVLLHRVFLIRPDIPPYDSANNPAATSINLTPSLQSDISTVAIGTVSTANTLGSVTNPANRALNWHRFPKSARNYFPQRIVDAPTPPADVELGWLPEMERFIVATDMLALDVRAFDPMAPILSVSGSSGAAMAISPSDPGYYGTRLTDFEGPQRKGPSPYFQANLNNIIGRGAFVDLGYLVYRRRSGVASQPLPPGSPPRPLDRNDRILFQQILGDLWPFGTWKDDQGNLARISHFSGIPSFRNGTGRAWVRGSGGPRFSQDDKMWVATTRHIPPNLDEPNAVVPGMSITRSLFRYEFLELFRYDTWSFGYEFDGKDQDGNGTIDQGTNGVDDDSKAGVDDPGEMETMAPYPVPLRGIEVRVRKWDPGTRQVRQVSIVSDFVPE